MNTTDDQKILDEARRRFKAAADADSENRENALDDLKFVGGEQWPEAVKRQREEDDRPVLTINRLNQFTRQVINDIRQNRPSVKVRAADSASSEQTAQVLNGLIRNIEAQSGADMAYDTAAEYAVNSSFGAWRIVTEYAADDVFEQDIRIKSIRNPFTVYPDPHSQEPDYSDMLYCFITEKLPREEFERRWPDAMSEWEEESESEADDEGWLNDDSVRVAEYWRVTHVPRTLCQLSTGAVVQVPEGMKYRAFEKQLALQGVQCVNQRQVRARKIEQFLITGREILERTDWAGKFIPIVIVVGDEKFVEGKRVRRSLIRDAKDPQRMYNYSRSGITEHLSLSTKAPWIGPEQAFDGFEDQWAQANTKNFAYLKYKGQVSPERQGFDSAPAGLMQEAMNAAEDMHATTGIYPANLGQKSNVVSGKAVLATQREGDVSTFNFSDNLTRAIRYCGTVLVDLVPAIYDTPRMVRILAPDGESQMVQINQEIIDPVQGKTIIHDLTTGKYDVSVSAGPSYTTQREESAERVLEIAKIYPPMLELAGDLVIKNLDLPEGDEIVKRIRAKLQQQQGQAPSDPIKLQQQIEAMKSQTTLQIKAEENKSKVMLEQQRAQSELQLEQAKMQQEAQIEKYKADLASDTALRVEVIRAAAKALADQTAMPVVPDAAGGATPVPPEPSPYEQMMPQMMQMLQETFAQLTAAQHAPRRIVRGPDGRAVGVETVQAQPQPMGMQ